MPIYYDYYKEEEIAVDIETKDPWLKEKGNGVFRKDGYVVGVSFSKGDLSEYYPLEHEEMSLLEKEKNRKYISDQLRGSNKKIFANGLYDLDWLINYEGFEVEGSFEDIQIAEPILDEYRRSYSLMSLSKDYLNDCKIPEKMRDYCIKNNWSFSPNSFGIEHLWKMPISIVEEYALKDAELTFKIFQKQKKLLQEQDLFPIYNLEMSLFPLLLQMRRQGVRLDKERLFKVGLELSDVKFTSQNDIDKYAGFPVNVNSGKDLQVLFDKLGIPIIYREPTELMLQKGLTRGNPNFDKTSLGKIDHPIARKILELRHISTLLNMFVHVYPELMVGDRLHCNFNPLRSDNYGTVSGRFSSSNPNLQQVSGKEEQDYIHSDSEILNGLIIRKLFVPEEGCDWLRFDWNQIEYRLIAHYAIGDESDYIRSRYNNDSSTDYHSELQEMTGIDNRKTVKTLNFGAAYGMGYKTMSKVYGWGLEDARAVYNLYHKKVPFIKDTSDRVSNKAKRIGFIKTILNRRSRLPSNDKAYVMFNRLIQGSAADIMKKAMADAYNAGVFNTLKPHITVHDEFDSSKPRTKEGEDAGSEFQHIMENCVKLRVPLKADCDVGSSWGDLKHYELTKGGVYE